MSQAKWLLGRGQGHAGLRLYCFSHGGGNANSYLPWQDSLGSDIELRAVELPLRGMRLHEAPYTTMAALVHDLAAVIAADHDGRPFAFFGHSLGALLAFELTRRLRDDGGLLPLRLIVSGSAAPWRSAPLPPLHELPDAQLIAALREMGGTPEAVLDETDLMHFLLPQIRADFALLAQYRYTPALPLPLPITVFAGRSDTHTSIASVHAWAEAGSASDVDWFDGGHFFIYEQQDAVLARLRHCLS